MATRNKRAVIEMNVEAQTVTYRPCGADGVPDGREKTVGLAGLPQPMLTLLALDRLRNKCMDAYSDPDVDVVAAVTETYDNLLAGNWSVRGGGAAETVTLFMEAYAAHTGQTVEDVRAKLNARMANDEAGTKALIAGWQKHPQIKTRMAEISARRAAERAKAAKAAAKEAVAPELADL